MELWPTWICVESWNLMTVDPACGVLTVSPVKTFPVEVEFLQGRAGYCPGPRRSGEFRLYDGTDPGVRQGTRRNQG